MLFRTTTVQVILNTRTMEIEAETAELATENAHKRATEDPGARVSSGIAVVACYAVSAATGLPTEGTWTDIDAQAARREGWGLAEGGYPKSLNSETFATDFDVLFWLLKGANETPLRKKARLICCSEEGLAALRQALESHYA